MINRREVLKLGAMTTALSATSGAVATPLLATPASIVDSSVRIAVADLRYTAAQGFAEGAAEEGFVVRALNNGDITPFWYHELSAIWQTAPVAVVGMTEYGPYFCLQQLAAQYGLQVQKCELLPAIISSVPLYSWMIVPRKARPTAAAHS